MPVYKISAKDKSGKVVRLKCEATSEAEANSYVIKSGYKPIAIINNNSVPNETKKEIRQQAQLHEFKNSKRKVNCPSCRTIISINALACPKCGQPITDKERLDEIARINRNQIIIAAVVIGFLLFVLFIHFLPEPKPESAQERQRGIEREVKREMELNEEKRQEIIRKESERQLEAMRPVLEKACAEGNNEACSELRKY